MANGTSQLPCRPPWGPSCDAPRLPHPVLCFSGLRASRRSHTRPDSRSVELGLCPAVALQVSDLRWPAGTHMGPGAPLLPGRLEGLPFPGPPPEGAGAAGPASARCLPACGQSPGEPQPQPPAVLPSLDHSLASNP